MVVEYTGTLTGTYFFKHTDYKTNMQFNSAEYGRAIFGMETIDGGVKGMADRDNLYVDMELGAVIYGAMENGKWVSYNGPPVDGKYPFDGKGGIASFGNAVGTVDSQYRPTGNTPNVGAAPKGEAMFKYGATWGLGD